MAVDIIEKSSLTILKELKRGQFTRAELELMQRLFQEIVNATKKKLSGEPNSPRV